MPACTTCGANLAPDENFCGTCGARQTHDPMGVSSAGGTSQSGEEMIESHIDDAQHEKAVADFKRESLLLTELEHASIPTVYDYFYEDISERFYLVMKFIPGSDLASRLRAAPAVASMS